MTQFMVYILAFLIGILLLLYIVNIIGVIGSA